MGEHTNSSLPMRFDGRLRLAFHPAKIASDAGLLAFRELEEAFRLTENASVMLSDPRHGKNTQHALLAQLPQGVYWRCPSPSSTGR